MVLQIIVLKFKFYAIAVRGAVHQILPNFIPEFYLKEFLMFRAHTQRIYRNTVVHYQSDKGAFLLLTSCRFLHTQSNQNAVSYTHLDVYKRQEKQRAKTLFWQIFIFFLLPFVFPAVFSLPVGIVCANIMRLAGYSAQAAGVFANSIIIALIIAAIYLLYFAATYLIAKRCVILDDEGR